MGALCPWVFQHSSRICYCSVLSYFWFLKCLIKVLRVLRNKSTILLIANPRPSKVRKLTEATEPNALAWVVCGLGELNTEHGVVVFLPLSRPLKSLARLGMQLAAFLLKQSDWTLWCHVWGNYYSSCHCHRVGWSSFTLSTAGKASGMQVGPNPETVSSKHQNWSHIVQTCSVLMAVYVLYTLVIMRY